MRCRAVSISLAGSSPSSVCFQKPPVPGAIRDILPHLIHLLKRPRVYQAGQRFIVFLCSGICCRHGVIFTSARLPVAPLPRDARLLASLMLTCHRRSFTRSANSPN